MLAQSLGQVIFDEDIARAFLAYSELLRPMPKTQPRSAPEEANPSGLRDRVSQIEREAVALRSTATKLLTSAESLEANAQALCADLKKVGL